MANHTEPVPGHCPVCGLNVFQTIIKREIRDGQDPDLCWRWWCQHCNSWFTWDAETRRVRNIETWFMNGLRGNVPVAAINEGKVRCLVDPKRPDEFDPPGYDHDKHFKT